MNIALHWLIRLYLLATAVVIIIVMSPIIAAIGLSALSDFLVGSPRSVETLDHLPHAS